MKYEYRVSVVGENPLLGHLEAADEAGWELVCASYRGDGSYTVVQRRRAWSALLWVFLTLAAVGLVLWLGYVAVHAGGK